MDSNYFLTEGKKENGDYKSFGIGGASSASPESLRPSRVAIDAAPGGIAAIEI